MLKSGSMAKLYPAWISQVQDVLLLRHRDTGNPKGAFVEFSTAEEVGKAVERNGMVRPCCKPRSAPVA